MSDDKTGKDFVVPYIKVKDGVGIGIRHRTDHTLEPVIMCDLKDGAPLAPGVSVAHRREGTEIFDVSYSAPTSGPAKVNSKSYQDGYDRIFGSKNLN